MEYKTPLESNDNNQETTFPPSEEIDLLEIGNSLIRNKKSILIITGLFLSASMGLGLIKKRIWAGEFQIVLSKPDKTSLLQTINSESANNLSSLVGGSGMNMKSKLKTQLEILKSPSVLLPIFNYVKQEKSSKGKKLEKWRFSDWMESNFTVEIEKGTYILNLQYRDARKDLILPVLNKISNAYQEYSKRDRTRELNNGITYLNTQVDIWEQKSSESRQKAQTFAIDNGLTSLGNDISYLADVEIIRLESAAKVKVINNQLKEIKSIKSNDQLAYILTKISPEPTPLAEQIERIETKIALKRINFKETDKSIINLLKQRDYLVDELKKQAIGYLLASQMQAKAELEAAERPKGILLKHSQLVLEAARDEETLLELRNKRRFLSLERARAQESWELITKPNQLNKPVAPSLTKLLGLGLISGLFTGIAYSLFSEKKKGLLFSKKELTKLLKSELTAELDINDDKNWGKTFRLLSQGLIADRKDGEISILILGDIDQIILNKIKSEIKLSMQNKKVTFTKNVTEIETRDNQIVLAELGNIKRKEVIKIEREMKIKNSNITGIILLIRENKKKS